MTTHKPRYRDPHIVIDHLTVHPTRHLKEAGVGLHERERVLSIIDKSIPPVTIGGSKYREMQTCAFTVNQELDPAPVKFTRLTRGVNLTDIRLFRDLAIFLEPDIITNGGVAHIKTPVKKRLMDVLLLHHLLA